VISHIMFVVTLHHIYIVMSNLRLISTAPCSQIALA